MNISLLVGAALLGKGARGLKIAEVGLATLGDDDNFFVFLVSLKQIFKDCTSPSPRLIAFHSMWATK